MNILERVPHWVWLTIAVLVVVAIVAALVGAVLGLERDGRRDV